MDLEIGEDGGFPSTVLQFHCRNLKSWVWKMVFLLD
jgi:hypothetical protein